MSAPASSPTLRLRETPVRISAGRVAVVLAVMCYVTVFNLTYHYLISPVFEFWGFGYKPLSPWHFWTTATLCVIPATWMPVKFSRPTLLLFYMQYFLIYVPAAFLVFYSIRPELQAEFAMKLVWIMFIGLTIVQTSYVLPRRPIRFPRLSSDSYWTLFVLASASMLAYSVVLLAGNFRLANFTDIYSVRFAMADIVNATGSRFGLYAQALLLALFFPILFAVGAFERRWRLLAAVGLGYVFLFGIGGAKSAILALVYLPLVFVLLTRSRRNAATYMALALAGALLSGFVVDALLPREQAVQYLGVVHFRLFTVPALTIPQYAVFFLSHPVTHMAHVTGFNWLLDFPYDLDVAYTIGWYYYNAVLGANSGMWAGDGLAGFGVWGIVLISTVCALVFWIFDCVTADLDPRFVGVTIAYSAVSFTNVSLFTTLITGGMGLVMLALAVAPRDSHGRLELPRVRIPVRRAHGVIPG